MIFAAIATILLCTLPGYIPGDAAWYVSQWADGLVITLWAYQTFKLTPDREFDRKFFMAAVVSVCVINNFVYLLWVYNPRFEYGAYPVYLVAVCWLLFRVRRRNYRVTGHDLNPKTVCLCFWRPNRTGSFFHSLLGAPVGSVGIYTGGVFWSYRWGQPSFTCRRVSSEYVSERYIVVDTGVTITARITAKLHSLLGTPARRACTLGFRANCVLTIAPILSELGTVYKPRLLELLPSLYAGRILNYVGQQNDN